MGERRSLFQRLTGSAGHDVDIEGDDDEQVVEMRSDDEKIEPSKSLPITRAEKNGAMDEQEGQLTVDVYQTPEFIVVKSTIAGVKPDDLDVSITNDMVTIRGTRRHDEEVTEEDYFYRECYWGSFSRSIILPVDIVSEKADASLKDGILTIRIPKADALLTKKVKVRGF
jgi:HSP20 family protein